jgi:hypothetical protein
MSLTKSLHTVTATLAVAKLLLAQEGAQHRFAVPAALAASALAILGYPEQPVDAAACDADVTVRRIVMGCAKLIREGR